MSVACVCFSSLLFFFFYLSSNGLEWLISFFGIEKKNDDDVFVALLFNFLFLHHTSTIALLPTEVLLLVMNEIL